MANGKQCGVGRSVAACNIISSKKINPEIEEISKRMRCLNIEVIDDTALIDTKNALISISKKRPPKDWKIKKSKKGKKAAAAAAAYSREEMLAISNFQNVEDQRKNWSEVYGRLAAPVAAEYDGLVAAPPRFYRRPIFDDGASAMGKRSPLKISVH